jgi:signal transduction histidine kinase
MAALHGYAQFLQSIDHDERGTAAAAGLLQEVRSLSDMSTAFLNFARPQPLQLEEVSLDELIAECARELNPLFDERRVELMIESASSAQPLPGAQASSLLIQGDARMLRQALLNLLRNAAEAIGEDKTVRQVAVNLSTQTERGQQWATISISDTGHGIPEADLQRIFIPFFTTKSQGHGVGLALAHRVITEHGGALTVANAADGGALFTVKLPI